MQKEDLTKIGKCGQIQYYKKDILGDGQNRVYSGIFKDQPVAVKLVKSSKGDQRHIKNEIQILKKLQHENVVRYWYDDISEDGTIYIIVMELCQTKFAEFKNPKPKIQEVDKWDLVEQAAKGIQYLHNKNIIHQDIKPSNILLVEDDQHDWRAKISDFGLSKFAKCEVDKSGDIFSFGLVVFNIIPMGMSPFEEDLQIGENEKPKFRQLFDSKENEKYKDLLQQMLSHDKYKRPTIDEFLMHHIFWTNYQCIDFIKEVADYLKASEKDDSNPFRKKVNKLSSPVCNNNWAVTLDELIRRTSNPEHKRYKSKNNVYELIKLIRDWHHHYNDIWTKDKWHNKEFECPESQLNVHFDAEAGGWPCGFQEYILNKFPNLIARLYPIAKEFYMKHKSTNQGQRFEKFFKTRTKPNTNPLVSLEENVDAEVHESVKKGEDDTLSLTTEVSAMRLGDRQEDFQTKNTESMLKLGKNKRKNHKPKNQHGVSFKEQWGKKAEGKKRNRKRKNSGHKFGDSEISNRALKCIDAINQVIRDMKEIDNNIIGCENLENIVEVPQLLAISPDDFYNTAATTSEKPIPNIKGTLIKLKSLFKIPGRRYRHIMICGGPGDGKSCLLRHVAKLLLRPEQQMIKDIELVIFIEFKQLVDKKKTALKKFITGFQTPEVEDAEKNDILSWMRKNSSKILFVFDGLDEFPSYNSLDDAQKANYDDKFFQSTFIKNIFNGHLFKDSIILSSSRQYAAEMLPVNCRPQKMIMLQGLTKAQIDKTITVLCKNKSKEMLSSLEEKRYFLYAMCSNPLYLNIAVAVHLKNPNFSPKTLTSLVLHILYNFIQTAHLRNKDVKSIFKKFTKLALLGMEKGTVVFGSGDLSEVGLVTSEMADFAVVIGKLPNQSIIISDTNIQDLLYAFSHKIYQEMISAFALLEKKPEDIKKFLQQSFQNNDNRWYSVIRFLFGIVLGENQTHIIKSLSGDDLLVNITKHKVVLEEILRHKLLEESGRADAIAINLIFESFSILKELIPMVRTIDLSPWPIIQENKVRFISQIVTPSLINCIKSLLKYMEHIELLDLNNPYLTDEAVQDMLQCDKFPKTSFMDINASRLTGLSLAKLTSGLDVQNLIVWNIVSPKEFSNFVKSISNYKNLPLKELAIKTSTINGKLEKLITCQKLQCLTISNSKFTRQNAEELFDSVCEHTQIPYIKALWLNICENPVGSKLIKFLNKCSYLQSLHLVSCGITQDSLRGLSKQNQPIFSVTHLSLSGNPFIVGKELVHLIRLFPNLSHLDLSACKVEKHEWSTFLNCIVKINAGRFIELLNVHFNPGISLVDLTCLVENSNITKIGLSCCGIDGKSWAMFVNVLKQKNIYLKAVNLANNKNLFLNTFKQSDADIFNIPLLNIGNCILSEQDLKNFCTTIVDKDFKFKSLNIEEVHLPKTSLSLLQKLMCVCKQLKLTIVDGPIKDSITIEEVDKLAESVKKKFNKNIEVILTKQVAVKITQEIALQPMPKN